MSSPNTRSGSFWPGTTDLATDRWRFASQWNARSEDVPGGAVRLLASLRGITSLDASLARWFRLEEPVTFDDAHLRNRLAEGRNKEDPSGELPSTVVLRNGSKDRRTLARITVSSGSSTSAVKDGFALELPSPAGAPTLYRAETMLALFDTVVVAWQPQWCHVRPYSLYRATGAAGTSVDVLASWIAYLDRSVYSRVGRLPGDVRTIEKPAGELFVLAPAPFELSLATIDGVRKAITLADEWSLLR